MADTLYDPRARICSGGRKKSQDRVMYQAAVKLFDTPRSFILQCEISQFRASNSLLKDLRLCDKKIIYVSEVSVNDMCYRYSLQMLTRHLRSMCDVSNCHLIHPNRWLSPSYTTNTIPEHGIALATVMPHPE
jgi:hypothetical protein